MSFFKKIQQPDFWRNFLKVFITYFIFAILISLLINSFRSIFSGDFTKVANENFSDGKWQVFFGYKVLFISLFALYITNKNMKS